MASDWAVFVKDNENKRRQKYPFWEKAEFNPGLINLFIAICDYDEEKRNDDDEKDTPPKP